MPAPANIATVRVQVDGTWHTLTWNETNQAYEKEISAPTITSFNKPGGFYALVADVTNTAGTTTTVDTTDATFGNDLKLVVKETIAPVITITSPANGATVINAQMPVLFTVVDELNGSGVNLDTVKVAFGGTTYDVTDGELTYTSITNGYSFTFTPASPTSDGSHTATIDAKDNDDNSAIQKSVTYTVETTLPALNVTAPLNNAITNQASINVVGATNPSTARPVTVVIKVGTTDQGAVTVASDGSFTKGITLANGTNTITITATDDLGKVSTITLTVTLDTSAPEFISIDLTPNPVDAGETLLISVKVM